jgi:NTE family protein
MSFQRFARIGLLFSGGAALGAYQAGASAALEARGVEPDWIAGTEIGAVNAAIIAGNPPHERTMRLRRFWQELSALLARRPRRWARRALHHLFQRSPRAQALLSSGELRALIARAVDFERVNSGAERLVLGALNLGTGGEAYFDNDRHRLGPDHILASQPLPGLAPAAIDRQIYGGGAIPFASLLDAPPADTLLFVIDGYDPIPEKAGGTSRAAREIATLKRDHDLKRMIALLGEHLPASARRNRDVRKCLDAAGSATITILRLVHEESAGDLAAKMMDFSEGALQRRWHAGESDVATSFAQPLWLRPLPPLSGAVVHELRHGVLAPPR